ncbi:methyltransferase family protein [Ulvibacter sp. MAR_2010_11]|uniref:class I SAM-dependent methyltransferase n=1 Tax=Ulvibacter sp. MAR_2010_11 TaxID=1250229 RepID=UPI000CAF9555|nr:class I SAM-dependent methyltransferase [Ulvibacter sp. MAR_2010_11]PKA82933.1 methyltransferase family protein [Ulvibacter sp. MAR_2010_11]
MKTKDFLVSGESFDLVFDAEQEMLVTFPTPKSEDLSKYYESDAYISHTDSDSGMLASIYQWVKKYSLSKKLKLITSLQKGAGSLLDIGAGTGDFLKLAKVHNWEVSGVEPNPGARALAKEKRIELEWSIDDCSGKQFDVVTLWHVLEHMPDLETTLKKIEALVKPGGHLIIAVPNYNSFDAKYYKEFWAAFDVPRHLWHFSRNSMKQLFSEQFHLRKTKPMIFDSFYVSLLSEKYKTRSTFSIRAFFIGLWSNIKAMGTKEYSSLIYCFKKEI